MKKDKEAEPLQIEPTFPIRTAEAARAAGVLADPEKDPARAIAELQALVMGCPHCIGLVTLAMVERGELGEPFAPESL